MLENLEQYIIFSIAIMTESEEECKKQSVDGEKSKWLEIRDEILAQLGTSKNDFTSFTAFTRLMNSPRDPSNLALIRIVYGILMIIDTHHERGLWIADIRWGYESECRFPFFTFLKPLPLEYMILLYFLMLLGATGIMLGYRYRLSCICFLIPYWYIFFLDKTHWNNHSYLFGLIGMQLMFSSAHHCWSLDGKRNPKKQNMDVPLWNYALIRGQIFLVYFIAGLKKTDFDWIGGYSMEKLGIHWVFDGFRLFLTDDQITHLVVHIGGFLLDLSVGFFMLMDFSRPYAFFFCGLFNLMNSRMFSIGMFPYVMIAIMPIFCSADWPKRIPNFCPKLTAAITNAKETKLNPVCIYKKSEESNIKEEVKQSPNKPNAVHIRHKRITLLFCLYFCIQAFLPYSHWLTKGYNTWTQGLYGYSWDMMVHHWRYVHTKILIVDKDSGDHFYLDPEAWTQNLRWTHHADMVKQYAHCVEERLATEQNTSNIEVHVDVWISLNRRFTQRMYDPTADILASDWSPFKEVTWILPLQNELTEWRQRLLEMEEKLFSESENIDVMFVTDFPGLHLMNYVDLEFGNTTLQVLRGIVEVEVADSNIILLSEGQSLQIPSGTFHRVSPLKFRPACYMYTYYSNTTNNNSELSSNQQSSPLDSATCPIGDGTVNKYLPQNQITCDPTKLFCMQQYKKDLMKKFKIWKRSLSLLRKAFYSILMKTPMKVDKKEIPLDED